MGAGSPPHPTPAERKAAPIPARAVPAIKVETITMTLVHINAYSDLINEIAARPNQIIVDGKVSCVRLRATSNAPAKPS